MKYFLPDIRVADETGSWLFGKKPKSLERLGGRPFGLPPGRWPKCSACGKSQSLLAQFVHDDRRLNLGRAGRVLFVFQCAHDPGMCDTWQAFSGANACFVLEPEEVTDAVTPIPADSPPLDEAVTIAGWVEQEDSVPAQRAAEFFSQKTLEQIEDHFREDVSDATRLGGVPRWLQSADEAPAPDWRFIGQLDSQYRFLTPPRRSYRWISQSQSGPCFGQGPNFGDGGIAYLFLRTTGSVPDGAMFWQCV